MRRLVTVFVLLLTVFAAPPHADAGRSKCRGFRFTNAIDPLDEVVADLLDEGPTGGRKRALRYIDKLLKRCPRKFKSEIGTAKKIAARVNRHGAGLGLENEFNPILRDAADFYEARVEEDIEYVADLLVDIQLAGNNTRKADEHIAEARRRMTSSRLEEDLDFRLSFIGSARAQVDRVKLSKVANAPKKCKGRRLKRGEYCTATLSGQVTVFNMGGAAIRRNTLGEIIGVEITFIACNGRAVDRRLVEFNIRPPFVGTHQQGVDSQMGKGLYLRGDGGFASPMRNGSSITITGFDLDNRYIGGEFQFTTSGTATDNAKFRIVSMYESN